MTNKKSTKRALLMSVLSLFLCVAMLAGTTFAWFTDSVSSENNIITAGNLDIELYWSTNAKDWTKVDGDTNIFKDNTLWEPGHTEVVYLKVVNEGSLALKYQLGVNIVEEIEGVNKDGKTFKLSDYIEFGVKETPEAVPYATREAALAAIDSYKIISAGYSKSSKLYPANNAKNLATEEYATLVVTMPEDVNNDANHNGKNVPSIKLGLSLFATQLDYEQDSFGSDHDAKASITVQPGESIADAIKNVEDGGIVYLANGVYDLTSGPITIENKAVTIIGVGDVTINKNYGSTHIFTIKNGAEVTFENIKMDGKGNTREGVYVRWNSKVTLKDVVIKNTGGLDIMIDEASDAEHGLSTASYVWLYNSHVEDVAMCASPVTSVAATQDTYVYFNYDKKSSVGSIEKQNINLKPENIYINGVNVEDNGMNLYVTNDAELAAALNTIKTNSKYWNTQVYVHMAAGTYSADHVINQYPQWNGVVGAGGSGNNYESGVPAGAPGTVITFVGETAATYGLRAATTPTVVFTGNVTVNGFGNAGSGFSTATAVTTFQNIAFDAANSVEANNEDYIVMYVKAGANNVNFDGCTFLNATHVTLGNNASDGVGTVNVTGCTFNDGGCLAGYVATLNVSDCVVTKASNGFLDKKKAGPITVENCDVVCDVYFLRTDNSGITVEVTNTTVDQTDVPNSKGTGLVVFRGSGHTVDFTDCDLTYETLQGGAGTGEMNIYTYTETEGVTYCSEAISGENVLYLVPADYAGETVNVAEGTTTIGNYAFAQNSNVKTVKLASTVRDLGRGFDSSSVETVVLNEGLTTISSRAFKETKNLTEVVISSTVTTIADDAFQKTGLATITIPANVEYVGAQAFGASKIVTVTFEGNPTIQNKAFRGCAELRTVNFEGDDVTFVNTTGQANCWICNSESSNPNTSTITFNVKNPAVAAKVKAAMGADTQNVIINCDATADATTGIWIDEDGNKCAYVEKATDLAAAINTNGATKLWLSSDNYKLPNVRGEDITLIGTGTETVVDYSHMGGYQEVSGCSFVFKNMTVVCAQMGHPYPGLQHTTSVSYENCHIIGTVNLFAPATFKNCTFDSKSAEHNVVTYGSSSVTFENCKFTYGDRSVNCYSENGAEWVANVSFTNCTFTKVAGAATTGAIETNSSSIKALNLTINNCTVNEGDLWFVATQYDSAKGANTTTVVDGKYSVATGEQLRALAANVTGEVEIVLVKDITLGNDTTQKKTGAYFPNATKVTIDGNKKTLTMKGQMEGHDCVDEEYAAIVAPNAVVTVKDVTIVNEKLCAEGTEYSADRESVYTMVRGTSVLFDTVTFNGGVQVKNNTKFVKCIFNEDCLVTDDAGYATNGKFCVFVDFEWSTDAVCTVDFEGCTFNASGYGCVKLAGDAGATLTANVKDCTFTNTCPSNSWSTGTPKYDVKCTGVNTKANAIGDNNNWAKGLKAN